MVLADTSVWISHFRGSTSHLSKLLNRGIIATHPFVIGELSCGNMKDQEEILELMEALPEAVGAEHEEVMEFIDSQGLRGHGLGWVDAHLLASALLTSTPIWTENKHLARTAAILNIDYSY